MKSVLRSTLILSSSAVASIGVGLISAKAGALLLGPAGLGVMGLLQSVVSIGTLAAGLASQPAWCDTGRTISPMTITAKLQRCSEPPGSGC